MTTSHCVEIGAVSFVNEQPVLNVAELHQICHLEVFRRVGATFFYCEQPDPEERLRTGAPCFNFSKHEVASFDETDNVVHARLLWSSLEAFDPNDAEHSPGAATYFRYQRHPTTHRPQWLRWQIASNSAAGGDKCKGDIVLDVAGPVPAVMCCAPTQTQTQSRDLHSKF